MSPSVTAVFVTCVLGPVSTTVLWFLVGFAMSEAGSRDVSLADAGKVLSLVAVAPVYAAPILVPLAASASRILSTLAVRSRWAHVAVGACVGVLPIVLVAIGMAWADGGDIETPALTARDGLFFLVPAVAGALCGEVYWRIPVRDRPAPDRSVDPPIGGPTG
jgi:hypothetical protein